MRVDVGRCGHRHNVGTSLQLSFLPDGAGVSGPLCSLCLSSWPDPSPHFPPGKSACAMRHGLAVGLTQPPSSATLDDLFIPKSFSILAKERRAGESLPPSHHFQQNIELECADKKKQQHNLEGSGKGAAGAMSSCIGAKKKPLK